ncbi:MAG: sigma-E processing peptidase SpoIIGA [Selenomonadales bacterium]|nr:sigma-E processing peptidase SpoIIGA [Selenomonadales bacterium]
MVIYWDILLFFNVVVNGLILFLTSVAVGIRVSWLRIWLGAFAGGCYVLADGTLIPQDILVRGFVSFLLIFIVFGYRSWRTFLFATAVFYLVSFVIGGAVLGWLSIGQNMLTGHILPAFGEVSGGILIGASVVFFCLRRSMERAGRAPYFVRVTAICEGRRDTFEGLIDTGNLLASPIRRTPVIVVEKHAIPSLLGKASRYFDMRKECEWVRDLAFCDDVLWQKRLSLSSYQTIDGAGHMLVGIRVDEVLIEAGGVRYHANDCIVAVTDSKLSADGRYEAIVPSRLLAEGETVKGERTWVS